MVSYRTGEVEALRVGLDRQGDAAYRQVFRAVQVPVVRFVAKTAGVGGNSITVAIEAGTNSDKKYTVVDGQWNPGSL